MPWGPILRYLTWKNEGTPGACCDEVCNCKRHCRICVVCPLQARAATPRHKQRDGRAQQGCRPCPRHTGSPGARLSRPCRSGLSSQRAWPCLQTAAPLGAAAVVFAGPRLAVGASDAPALLGLPRAAERPRCSPLQRSQPRCAHAARSAACRQSLALLTA